MICPLIQNQPCRSPYLAQYSDPAVSTLVRMVHTLDQRPQLSLFVTSPTLAQSKSYMMATPSPTLVQFTNRESSLSRPDLSNPSSTMFTLATPDLTCSLSTSSPHLPLEFPITTP